MTDDIIGAFVVLASLALLMSRLNRGFNAVYLPTGIFLLITATIDLTFDISAGSVSSSVPTAITLVIWVYITWRDWGPPRPAKGKEAAW